MADATDLTDATEVAPPPADAGGGGGAGAVGTAIGEGDGGAAGDGSPAGADGAAATAGGRAGVVTLTRTGWGVAATAVALVVGGWALGFEQLLVLGVAAGAALLLGLVWVAGTARLALAHHVEPAGVSVGQGAEVVVRVANEGRLGVRSLRLEEPVAGVPLAVEVPPLEAGAATEVRRPLPTGRRGLYAVGPLRARRTDPLGLVQRRQGAAEPVVLTVYPRVRHVDPFAAGRRLDLEGPREGSPGSGTTFYAVRDYRVGDDVRHIHWRSTARLGELMVREHVDTAEPRMAVVLDNRAEVHTEASFEVAVEVAASLVVSCLDRHLPVALHLADGDEVTGGAGVPALAFLEPLAAAATSTGGRLAAVLHRLAAEGGYGALAVVTAPGPAGLAAEVSAALAPAVARAEAAAVVNVRPDAGTIVTGSALRIDAGDLDAFALAWERGGSR